MDYEEADDVPNCECGRVMRVQTMAGEWRCHVCDPQAKERYRRTQRLLALAAGIRERQRDGGR